MRYPTTARIAPAELNLKENLDVYTVIGDGSVFRTDTGLTQERRLIVSVRKHTFASCLSFIPESKNYPSETAPFEIVQKEISTTCKKTYFQPKNC